MTRFSISTILLAAAAVIAPVTAHAEVRITEFMYKGASDGNREFIELTNIGNAGIDITGWSYNDDNTNNPVTFGNAFGLLGANESIILTEMTADAFRSYWNLDSSVRIFSIGGNSNLGNGDTINIYNSASQSLATLVDSVTYPAGTTAGVSRNRPASLTGTATNSQFVYSATGDAFGSAYASGAQSDLANPGRFATQTAAVPEPATWAMMIAGFGLIGLRARRSRKVAFA
ncbi:MULTISPECIES: lamin tail domain-containing protein [unclassified Sphingobium]|uniref:lamin tail domain-containing protein n=1 Tax=unclassified Sphingobium TaxID=2611147 RepID=UPI002224F278|nr:MULTISPECIES: lamin tail domain-containing protein [unclassified Sphingobium]MCW2412444.1 hypothetical protein [Sphingobium sp. B8D3D]MCW2415259.1 hypothetical protein [Sphingobium sp. B8D3A]